MSADPSWLSSLVFAALLGAGAGLVLPRLLAGGRERAPSRRLEDSEHRIRALEADLRIAQRGLAEAKTAGEGSTTETESLRQRVSEIEEKAGKTEARLRESQALLQHECRKTAELRQELCDRAEEMARTHVQLRDVENELGVAKVGSDVVIDQIASLERERDDLTTIVEELRRELAARVERRAAERRKSPRTLPVDC